MTWAELQARAEATPDALSLDEAYAIILGDAARMNEELLERLRLAYPAPPRQPKTRAWWLRAIARAFAFCVAAPVALTANTALGEWLGHDLDWTGLKHGAEFLAVACVVVSAFVITVYARRP